MSTKLSESSRMNLGNGILPRKSAKTAQNSNPDNNNKMNSGLLITPPSLPLAQGEENDFPPLRLRGGQGELRVKRQIKRAAPNGTALSLPSSIVT
jgi:hypothetical protein